MNTQQTPQQLVATLIPALLRMITEPQASIAVPAAAPAPNANSGSDIFLASLTEFANRFQVGKGRSYTTRTARQIAEKYCPEAIRVLPKGIMLELPLAFTLLAQRTSLGGSMPLPENEDSNASTVFAPIPEIKTPESTDSASPQKKRVRRRDPGMY